MVCFGLVAGSFFGCSVVLGWCFHNIVPGQGYDQMFGAIFPHGQVGVAVDSRCHGACKVDMFHSHQDPKVFELTRDVEKLLGAIRGVPCLTNC